MTLLLYYLQNLTTWVFWKKEPNTRYIPTLMIFSRANLINFNLFIIDLFQIRQFLLQFRASLLPSDLSTKIQHSNLVGDWSLQSTPRTFPFKVSFPILLRVLCSQSEIRQNIRWLLEQYLGFTNIFNKIIYFLKNFASFFRKCLILKIIMGASRTTSRKGQDFRIDGIAKG